MTNPPYGERISTPNLLATYKMIGERLKHQFTGNDAWVLSYREECFEQIGLKPSIKIPLYNGSLECEFRKYQMFDGKMRVYREEGGVVKTEEEKRQMAEKHRFKKEREFKKRLDEQEENEGADIRNFKFHSLEDRKPREPRSSREPREGRDSRGARDARGSRPSRDSRGPKKPFNKGGRNFDNKGGRSFDNKGGRDFGKKNRRFHDEDDD